MLTIDTDLLRFAKNYRVNAISPIQGGVSNVDEAEALSNPEEVALGKAFNKDLDYKEIIKALNFGNPQNRLKVLLLLNKNDLIRLMAFMDKENLLMGMKFFNKEKLLKFVFNFDKKLILKMLLNFYSKKQLLEQISINDLHDFIGSPRIKPSEITKVLAEMPKHVLAQIYEGATSKSAGNKSHKELMKEIGKLEQGQVVEGLRSLPYSELLKVTNKLIENNNELFNEFSKESLFKIVKKWDKNTMIQSMRVLDEELIVKMLKELPHELMALTVTLMDPGMLAYLMEKFHSDVLEKLAA